MRRESGKPSYEMSYDEAQAVYDCLKDAMYKNYTRAMLIPAES